MNCAQLLPEFLSITVEFRNLDSNTKTRLASKKTLVESHCHGLLASGIRYDVSKDVAILAISPIADRHLAALREAARELGLL